MTVAELLARIEAIKNQNDANDKVLWDGELKQLFQEIVTALGAIQSTPGPTGAPGPIGATGPRGPQGEPGVSANPNELAVLREQVQLLGKITRESFQLIRDNQAEQALKIFSQEYDTIFR
jgi:hypothetical protein